MNVPAFEGSLMLDDFAEVTEISSPFWLGISRENIAGGWNHDRDQSKQNRLINWDKEQFVKFDENMNWGNAVFGNREKWKNIDGNLKRRFICIKDIKDKSFQRVISQEVTVTTVSDSNNYSDSQSVTSPPVTRGIPLMTNSTGTSLFTEIKYSTPESTSSPDRLSVGQETTATTTVGTLAGTTESWTWSTSYGTTETMASHQTSTFGSSIASITTTIETSAAEITITTPSQNNISEASMAPTIKSDQSPAANNSSSRISSPTLTSNCVHVDVHVDKIVFEQSGSQPDYTKPSITKQGQSNNSTKSTEKLSKDANENSTSTKIWITVGVCLERKDLGLFSLNKGVLVLALLGTWIWSCHGTRILFTYMAHIIWVSFTFILRNLAVLQKDTIRAADLDIKHQATPPPTYQR